jgi:signal transduction histidine kinase
MRLRVLVAATCAALAAAAWAIACGHVLGTRVADGERRALDEARDLAAIAAVAGPAIARSSTTPVAANADAWLDALAARVAPPGGYLVLIDDAGRVVAGAGANVAAGSALDVGDLRCRAGGRALACAARRLDGGRRLVAAVPSPPPVSAGLALVFALAGAAMIAVALGVGVLVGAAPARELDRVAGRLDALAGGRSLDIGAPIAVTSLDEIGELSAALDRLRARLEPALAEYRAALTRAQSADRARDEFLALVSAELRAPLDELIAATEAMLDSAAEPLTTEQADDVRTVRSAGRHLSDLIDEVLDVSAIASGRVTLRLEQVDLGELAADVAKTQRPLVQKKGVELRVTVDGPAPLAYADGRRLRQVLMNLVSNAVKFTERGEIEITVRRADATVEIAVRDTGPGIAPEALPRLFQEFVQLGSLKQRAHGTGLGLAICKRLVEAHGGEISAASEVGRGSTFRVLVPTSGPPAPAQERAA